MSFSYEVKNDIILAQLYRNQYFMANLQALLKNIWTTFTTTTTITTFQHCLFTYLT